MTQTQQIKMIILNQVQVNLIYNTNYNLFLWIEIFISTQCSKKQPLCFLVITSANEHQFLQFFHCQIPKKTV